jgi:hypothetical protein
MSFWVSFTEECGGTGALKFERLYGNGSDEVREKSKAAAVIIITDEFIFIYSVFLRK